MALTPNDLIKVTLLLEGDEVPDPYYGNEDSLKKFFEFIEKEYDKWSKTLQKTQS